MNLHRLDYSKLKKLNSEVMYQEVNHFCIHEGVTHKYIVILNFSEDESFDYDYVECRYLISELDKTEFFTN